MVELTHEPEQRTDALAELDGVARLAQRLSLNQVVLEDGDDRVALALLPAGDDVVKPVPVIVDRQPRPTRWPASATASNGWRA